MLRSIVQWFRKAFCRIERPDSAIKGQKLDYSTYAARMREGRSQEEAMQLAIGGSFELIGPLERELLKIFGLQTDHYLIDVGCGSGRLARPLMEYLSEQGRYLGIDVVNDLLDHARKIVDRPNWRFELADGFCISEDDNQADMICFFSLVTHLLHEQSYLYLQDAKRVLKPGGKIVFSFIEFEMPGHWLIFESNIADVYTNHRPLNQFISRNAIHVWADHLGLTVDRIVDSNEALAKLSTKPGGPVSPHALGQSICVLSKL